MTYDAWRNHNAANITEWLTPDQLRAECGRLLEVRPPSPELLLMHAMRALEDARAQALEQAAQACDRRVMGDLNREDMEARACAAAVRALKLAPQPPGAPAVSAD